MTEVAIHEAGHAIIFDALGIPMEFVTIAAGCDGEEAQFEGCVKLKNDINPVCDVILATLAGPGASFYIAGICPDSNATVTYRSDQRVLMQIHKDQKAAGTYNDFWLRLQQFLAGWIKSWLLNHKGIVLRFAEFLEEQRTLRGEKLRQALDSVWGSSKPNVETFRSEAREALRAALG